MHRLRIVITGTAGLLGLAALIIGAPLLLIGVAGWPLPHDLPSTDAVANVLGRQMTFAEMTNVLAVLGWLVWAQFVWCTAVEAVAQSRHQANGNRVRFAIGTQALARTLVLAALMLTATMHRSTPAPLVSVPMTAAVAVQPEQPIPTPLAAAASPAQLPTITVKARDDLWHLAETHLGDPMRWREIFGLNRGVAQPDGHALTRSDLIRPGWQFQLPADAVGTSSSSTPAVGADPQLVPSEPPAAPIDETTPSAPVDVTTPSSTPSTTANTSPSPQSAPSNDQRSERRTDMAHEIPKGVIALGLTAAGVVALVDARRRLQRRRRSQGRLITMPPEQAVDTEFALRVAANAAPAARLDAALRALASCIQQADHPVDARISAVRVADRSIEVLFAGPVNAPAGPFDVDVSRQAWTLDSSINDVSIGALATRMAAPLPGLVSVGTVDGATVLIDTESHGLTVVAGESTGSSALFDMMLIELATSVWTDEVNVIAVGDLPAGIEGERVRRVDHISDVLDEIASGAAIFEAGLAHVGSPSTLAARLAAESTEGWVPTIVACHSIDDPDFARLLEVVGDGRRGIALLALGETDVADRRILVTADGVQVDPPGIAVDRPTLQATDVAMISEILSAAQDLDGGPAYETAGPVIDLREPASVARAERTASIIEIPSPDVLVKVLGPVDVTGAAKSFGRRKPVELVAYLALQGKAVSGDRLKTALWPEREPTGGTFNTTVTSARSALGAGADNVSYLMPSVASMYELSSSVMTDFGLFRALVARASQQAANEAIDSLTAAMQLVRGTPFQDAKGYEWASAEGFITEMQAAVADAAHRLAALRIESEDPEQATWAARQGLLVSSVDEALYRDLMLAAARQGQISTVKALMNELCSALDVDPDDGLQEETVALYKQLLEGRTRTGRSD